MSSLFSSILEISLAVGCIILVVFALSPWLNKRFTAKWKYWLWLVLAIRLLIPVQIPVASLFGDTAATQVPTVQITVSDTVTQPLEQILTSGVPSESGAGNGVNGGTDDVNAGADANQATPAPANPWYYYLSPLGLAQIAWIIGIAVFLVWHFCRYWSCLWQLSRWRRFYATELTGQLCQELGIRKTPPLYISDRAPGPMMIGFFSPCIYLPDTPDNEVDLYFILKHELIHWQRKDVWYKLLLLIACAVHWFNPLVHIAFRCACRDLEMSCDEAVIANCDATTRRQYSEAIFNYMKKQVCRPAQLSTYFNGGIKTMKKRFSNILNTAVKRRGRAALLGVMLVLVAVGGLFACSVKADTDVNVGDNTWAKDVIAELGAMDEQGLNDYINQPIADGTIEEIVQQVVSRDIAQYFINNLAADGIDDATIVDAQILSIDLLASYDEDSSQPLYVYQPEYRLQPDDPNKVVLAGARALDDEGWIINSNNTYSRIMVTPNGDDKYSFVSFPAFDLDLNTAVRESLYGLNSAAMDFSMIGTNFLYGLGRQVGDYPWNEDGVAITDGGTIENTDMPGAQFHQATIAGTNGAAGNTEMIWYQIEESGLKYIYRLATTDPYVSCGFSGYHHANVGQSEAELLEGWGDVLSENSNIVYSADGDNLCEFDKVYSYPLQVTTNDGIFNFVMNFYLNDGVIAGIEMEMVLD